jgi:hypothetical protein
VVLSAGHTEKNYDESVRTLARQAFTCRDIYQRTPDKHTHTHTHKHTHTEIQDEVCQCVWRLTKRAPVSSRRQLLLLWCYACSLINIDRRVRSTAHLTVRQSLNLTSSVNCLQNTKAQTAGSTPLRKNSQCCISRTSARR